MRCQKAIDPVAEAARGEEMTLEARVDTILTSSDPNKGRLDVGLRFREHILTASIDAKTVGEGAWALAGKLTPESIVRVTGHVEQLGHACHVNGNGNGAATHPNGDGKPHTNGNGNGAPVTSTTNDAAKPLTSGDVDNHVDLSGDVPEARYAIQVSGLIVIALASEGTRVVRADGLTALGLEERLDNRILDVRAAASGALFKLHSGMCQLMVEFLCSNGFHWVHTPRIVSATVAGDKEYFHLPYFGRDAWLAQSSQHHKQMALSMDLERVFEIGPVFRAEAKSSSSARHMTEFTVLDIGMTFDDHYHEVVDLIEDMLVFVLKGLQERKQFQHLVQVVQKLYPSARPFNVGLDKQGRVPRISFVEAKRILAEDLNFDTDASKDLTDYEESALGQHFRNSAKYGNSDFFTIDQYPASMRQFNSAPSPNSPGYSNTWDCIIGGREICSGSQRINDLDELKEAMRAGVCGAPMNPDEAKWDHYLTAFKSGMPRHGGVGLGVNRLLQSFLGLQDVREVSLFPRDVNRLAP